jgi:hypothetical protein
MESVDAKMVRAREHLNTLHAEARVFFETTTRNFILKSDGREAWIVHYIEGSIPPIRLGVLLGECVFNIRSALDNLVCGLIRTADSYAPCKGTQFPICNAGVRLEGRGVKIEWYRVDIPGIKRLRRPPEMDLPVIRMHPDREVVTVR